MDKEVTCPWCLKQTTPKAEIIKKQNGDVRERRCTECGKILAAYLADEGDFISMVRKFDNN